MSGRQRYQDEHKTSPDLPPDKPAITGKPTITSSGANNSGGFLAMLRTIAAMFGTARVFMLCAGIIAAVIGLSAAFSLAGTVSRWFQPKTTYDLNAVINAAQTCGELTTYRAYFEAVADHREERKIPGRSRKILMIFRGTVDWGLDMSRANIEIFSEDKKITITLPPAKYSGSTLSTRAATSRQ